MILAFLTKRVDIDMITLLPVDFSYIVNTMASEILYQCVGIVGGVGFISGSCGGHADEASV